MLNCSGFTWVLSIITLYACGGGYSGEITRTARMETSRELLLATQLKVAPLCNGKPSIPSVAWVTTQSGSVKQNCGMVYHEMLSRPYIKAFSEKLCHEGSQSTSSSQGQTSACRARFGTTFTARMRERYPAANPYFVEMKCTAYPIKCSRFDRLELWYLISHNQVLNGLLAGKLNSIQVERDGRQAVHLENVQAKWRQALLLVGGTMEQTSTSLSTNRPLHCTTYTHGNFARTQCF